MKSDNAMSLDWNSPLERERRALRNLMANNKPGTEYFVRFYDHFAEFQQTFIVTEFCLVRFISLTSLFNSIIKSITFFQGGTLRERLDHQKNELNAAFEPIS